MIKKRVAVLSLVVVVSLEAGWIIPDNEANIGEPVEVKQESNTNIWGEEIDGDEFSSEEVEKTQIKEVYIDDFKRLGSLKIALLVPKKVIGSYSKKVSNAILSYLVHRGMDFDFEVFDSHDESVQNLALTTEKLKAKGYNYIIAVLTKNGAYSISEIEKDSIVYLPTINKKRSEIISGNLIFGGIDYKEQVRKLLDFTNDKVAILSGESDVARELTSYVMSLNYTPNIYIKTVKNLKINPKYLLKNNNNLQNASIFLNMPLVTSASIVSSFATYNIKPFGLFSTQVNYSPLLFNMIQSKDRKNFYIANSIGYVNSKLNDIAQNMGVKLKYNWVAYSSVVGVDKIYSRFYDSETIFYEEMIERQIVYKNKVVKIVGDEFKRVK